MIAAFLFCSLLAGGPQNETSWKPLNAVRLIGTERHFDGPARPISLARRGGQTMFITSGGLQGSLLGTERKEVNGPDGVYTWIVFLPSYSLQLPSSSTSHYASLLQPVRFSRQSLAGNRAVVEKALKGTIVRSSEGRTAERDCLVLTVADKSAPSTRQEFWIDKETGIILKRRDRAGQTDDYELLMTRLNIAPDFTPLTFAPPEGSVRIKGPVDPEVLLSAGATTVRQPSEEIRRKAKEIGASAWLRSLETPAGFRYVHTVTRRRAAVRSAPLAGSALGAAEVMPGGLPPGWTVAGEVDPNTGAIDMRFTMPNGGGPRAIINGPKPGDDGSSFGIKITSSDRPDEVISMEFVAYVAPEGGLIIAPGKSAREAEDARQRSRRAFGAQGALVQSDFLDEKSGDTVSLMQSRGVDLKVRLRGFAAADVLEHKVEGLGAVRRHEVRSPYPVRVIAWKSGDTDYLLSSSRLSFEELERLALSAKPL